MSFWSQKRDDAPSTPRSEPPRAARPAPSSKPAPQKAAATPRSSAGGDRATLIAAGSTFIGEITGDTELLVRGVVKGEIDLDSRVVVGPEGRVEGDIRAQSIEIAGHVNGNVRCESLLKVHSSGSLEGEVVTVDLDVDSGCFLSGRVQRVKAGEVSPGRSAAKAKEKSSPSGDSKAASTQKSSAAADAPGKTQKNGSEKSSGAASSAPEAGDPSGKTGDGNGASPARAGEGRSSGSPTPGNRQRDRQGKGARRS